MRRPILPVPVYEVMTSLNRRSSLGRVVVNPPAKMAPMRNHQTEESWYFCFTCGRSTLNQGKYSQHLKHHAGRDYPFRPQRNSSYSRPHRKSILERRGNHETEDELPHSCSQADTEFRQYHDAVDPIPPENAESNRHSKSFPKMKTVRDHMVTLHSGGDGYMQVGLRDQVLPMQEAKIKDKVPVSSHSWLPNSKNVKTATPLSSKTECDVDMDCSTDVSVEHILYRCKRCQKTFLSLGSLRTHFSVHNQVKYYDCKLCDRFFGMKGTLERHMKVAHTNGPYKCPYCPCRFELPKGIQTHIQIRHADEGCDASPLS